MRLCFLLFSSAVLASVLKAEPAASSPDKLSGLVTNSPFGSARSSASGAANANEPLEFRAVLEEGRSRFFSIFDPATRRSTWVEMNDPVNGFAVKAYDSAKETVTVEYQGKSLSLAIKRAPAVAQALQLPQVQPAQNGTVPPNAAPATPGAPAAVDQQRIQQIQEEIRRRRALRSQAMVPGGAGAGPAGGAQPNYGSGPQPQPSSSSGPQPQPSGSFGPVPQPGATGSGPQPIPQKN